MLGVSGDVSSPTFAIVNEYHGERPVYHIDLYRLDNLTQAMEIGIEEYMSGDNICLIEWPELLDKRLPSGAVDVHIVPNPDGSRSIDVTF